MAGNEYPGNPWIHLQPGVDYRHPALFIGYLILPGGNWPNLNVTLSGFHFVKK
jgi:hypothetical protein